MPKGKKENTLKENRFYIYLGLNATIFFILGKFNHLNKKLAVLMTVINIIIILYEKI